MEYITVEIWQNVHCFTKEAIKQSGLRTFSSNIIAEMSHEYFLNDGRSSIIVSFILSLALCFMRLCLEERTL